MDTVPAEAECPRFIQLLEGNLTAFLSVKVSSFRVRSTQVCYMC